MTMVLLACILPMVAGFVLFQIGYHMEEVRRGKRRVAEFDKVLRDMGAFDTTKLDQLRESVRLAEQEKP